MRFSTKAIHVGEEPDYEGNGEVVSPIHLSTTFARKDPEIPTKGYEYTRTGNPTRETLEKKLAALENGKHALAFSSGLAAETTLLLSVLKKGDSILASDDLYGGTRRIFNSVIGKFGVSFKTADMTEEGIEKFISGDTRVVWIETPSNPLLKVIDIGKVARICRENDLILVVDNTFASPYFQNPLKLGADVVLHSTTKYINGHSDSLGGAIITSSEELYEKVKFNQNAVGAVLSPFDSYLVMRGLKTLEVRMERHESNAKTIASYLSDHGNVESVLYPGLSSNRFHTIARRQMTGFGGMLSFYLKGGREDVRNFLSRLNYFSLAESLGGVESLIEVPYHMTHASIPEQERRRLGVTDNLIRVSVGIENIEDLIEDLQRALG
jgi:cystathionine gamma-lyase